MTARPTPGRQVGVTLLALLLAGAAGGVLWHQLVDLPVYTRTADNGTMDALELSGSVAIDAWYAVVAATLALLVGAGCTLWAGRSPRLNVVALFLGGGAAGLLMLGVGRWLGPGDLEARLADAAVGDKVPVELVPNSTLTDVLGLQVPVIFLVWPIAALAGAVVVLLLAPAPQEDWAAR